MLPFKRHSFGRQPSGSARTRGGDGGAGNRDGGGDVPDEFALSDDDALLVPKKFKVVAASDSHVHHVHSAGAQSQDDDDDRSDDEDDSSAGDSFVVPDHNSDVSEVSSSPDVHSALRDICLCLRKRRQSAQCPQCLRIMRSILKFVFSLLKDVPAE